MNILGFHMPKTGTFVKHVIRSIGFHLLTQWSRKSFALTGISDQTIAEKTLPL